MRTIGKLLSIILVLCTISIFVFFFGRSNIPLIGEFYQNILSFIEIFYYNNYVNILFEFLFLFLFLVISYYTLVQKKKEIVASLAVCSSIISLVILGIATFKIYQYFTSNICIPSMEKHIYRCASGLSSATNTLYFISQIAFFVSTIIGWHNITDLVQPNNPFAAYCKQFVKIFLWVLTLISVIYAFYYKLSDYSTAPLSIHQWGPPLIITICASILLVTITLFISDYSFEPTDIESTETMDYEELKQEANKWLDQKQQNNYPKKKIPKEKSVEPKISSVENESALPIQVKNLDTPKLQNEKPNRIPEKSILFSSLAKKQEVPSSPVPQASNDINPANNTSNTFVTPTSNQTNADSFHNIFDMYQNNPSKNPYMPKQNPNLLAAQVSQVLPNNASAKTTDVFHLQTNNNNIPNPSNTQNTMGNNASEMANTNQTQNIAMQQTLASTQFIPNTNPVNNVIAETNLPENNPTPQQNQAQIPPQQTSQAIPSQNSTNEITENPNVQEITQQNNQENTSTQPQVQSNTNPFANIDPTKPNG